MAGKAGILYGGSDVGDTRPDLCKVGDRMESNMSLTSQVCCYRSSDWSK